MRDLAKGVWRRIGVLGVAVLAASGGGAAAEMQFDLFCGFDGVVPRGAWFPVTCEVYHDGPDLRAVLEVEEVGGGEVWRTPVDLPSETRKRFSHPAFSRSANRMRWEARLLDASGRVLARNDVSPRAISPWGVPLLGALSRSVTSGPEFPDSKGDSSGGRQPRVARLNATMLPEHPLSWRGLGALYLAAEVAPDLTPGQSAALLDWLSNGGHLIVAVERPLEVQSTAWLRDLVPVRPTDVMTAPIGSAVADWTRGWATEGARVWAPGEVDPGVEGGDLERLLAVPVPAGGGADSLIAVGEVLRGRVAARAPVAGSAEADGIPLVVQADHGRGKVTFLAFSPEREPFVSWAERGWFWARAAELPLGLFSDWEPDFNELSSDGIFGAMLDSRQVRKLPMSLLLLVLLVYLAVIGPVDLVVLRRIRKPMWTWLTFPGYVIGFSLLIYWIGHRLRAGELEWNQLHVVDLLESGDVDARWSGSTYGAVYSPETRRFALDATGRVGAVRTEYLGGWAGAGTGRSMDVSWEGDGVRCELAVPVWTSRLVVGEWWDKGPAPVDFEVEARSGGRGWSVRVAQSLPVSLSPLRVVVGGRVHDLGRLEPGGERIWELDPGGGVDLGEFLKRHGRGFAWAVRARQRSMGDTTSGWLEDLPQAAMAASFLGEGFGDSNPFGEVRFWFPSGLDLSGRGTPGRAVLLGWAGGHSPAGDGWAGIEALRGGENTLFRLTRAVAGGAGVEPGQGKDER